jgi:tyrosyl-tRNA synthetase
LEQVGKILNTKKCEIHYNSEWFSKWDALELIKLTAQFSTKRILERDDFEARMKDPQAEVFHHETLYPLLQAYDSVAVKADVEIGGTDQKFNMLAGRDLQRKTGLPEQDVITCPLLVGLDGVQKMSKSLGNYVGLTDAPADMYRKIMSLPDNLILQYFELVTDLTLDEIKKLPIKEKPRDTKMKLAREVVKIYHGTTASKTAEENFVSVFQKHEKPEAAPVVKVKMKSGKLIDLLMETKLFSSKSEARRVIEERGVKVDGKVITDPSAEVKIGKSGVLIQKGKRHFVKIEADSRG